MDDGFVELNLVEGDASITMPFLGWRAGNEVVSRCLLDEWRLVFLE